MTVQVTFPESYHSAELAGKAAEFRCVIHEIRVKTPYELDDVFAQEIGGCYTFEEMREQLVKSLQSYVDERGEMDLQDRLLRQAAETLEMDISGERIDQAVTEHMQNMQAQLSQQGLSLEMYCTFMNTTEEKLREDARPTAVVNIKLQAAIEKVVELEKLTASQEDIGEAVALIARQNHMTVEELKPYYDAEFEAAVVRSVLSSKAMKLIRDAAVVTENP